MVFRTVYSFRYVNDWRVYLVGHKRRLQYCFRFINSTFCSCYTLSVTENISRHLTRNKETEIQAFFFLHATSGLLQNSYRSLKNISAFMFTVD